MPCEFAPAFGVICVEAIVAAASAGGWSLELLDSSAERLCLLPVVEVSAEDLVVSLVTAPGVGEQRGTPMLFRIIDAAGETLLTANNPPSKLKLIEPGQPVELPPFELHWPEAA